jgi:membrane dipeptidase
MNEEEVEERTTRLHHRGVVDLHFDLLMDLFEKRGRTGVLAEEFLPEFETGNIAVVAAAIYLEDRYVPESALQVGVDQIARLHAEAERTDRLAICKSFADIEQARAQGRVAVLISMEGVEPLGDDLDLLRVFYELGVRIVGLTHARTNAAGSGGIFAQTGSSTQGLTEFGREVVRECERLGVIVDLAHINPHGFEDIMELATKPPIVSHTNARKYYDIERNISDEQIRQVGARGGVIGLNSVLVSRDQSETTLDRYIDHIQVVIDLAGIDAAGIGFDFFEFIWQQWPEERRQQLAARLAPPNFIPQLRNHAHARNLTRRLVERGFRDEQIEKILRGNWMRILKQLL